MELYALLASTGEAEIIHTGLRPDDAVLELGAGTGRTTHRLLELGHSVTAVDQSPEMLAHIEGARTVCADIETLALGRRFEGVVLASFLIHVPSAQARAALLCTCRLHVAAGGAVIIQRRPVESFAGSRIGQFSKVGDINVGWRAIARNDSMFTATIEYSHPTGTWTQTFTHEVFSDAVLLEALSDADLHFERWLDAEHQWLLARP